MYRIDVVCLVSFVFIQNGYCQDADDIKQFVLKSIARIENYPAVVITGDYASNVHISTAKVYVRGKEIWGEFQETDYDSPQEVQERKRSNIMRIMGCELPIMRAFDGKRFYLFNPFSLTLRIEPSQRIVSDGAFLFMLPHYWITIGSSDISPFRKLVEGKNAEVKVEPLSEGRWKLSQKGLEMNLKDESLRSRVGIRERFIIVDPKLDYLATEYEGNGAMGRVAGQFEWEKQDGSWYVKHGKHTINDKLMSEWHIKEISFDANKCRARFDDMESVVPFATQVTIYDGSKKAVERYKGGKAGEEEFKLRDLALAKYRLSGD
jgi:hypothetical protein